MASTTPCAGPRTLRWLDCQTGTTATRLAEATGIGEPATDWPHTTAATSDVVLTCRATVDGLRAAIGHIDQYLDMDWPGRLLGLACVADTGAAIPPTVADHLDMLATAGLRVWRVGWGAPHADPALLGAFTTPRTLQSIVQQFQTTVTTLGWTQPTVVAA